MAIITVLIGILVPFRAQPANLDFYIVDSNQNYQYEVRENLEFLLTDTLSYKNRKMVWEFGNGDSIVKSNNVHYTYNKEGKYLVTLTIDKKFRIPKYIDVINIKQNTAFDSIPRIYAVDTAYVNEQIVFLTNSPGVTSWYWEFGESGTIDAYERQVIYTYKKAGNYLVKLKTNRSKYPVYHQIHVMPLFQKIDSEPIDSLGIVANDIKERLQAIADAGVRSQSVYYDNLRHIERHYKCPEDDMVVVVNGALYNDLYSYCQGLHYLEGKGAKTIEINQVVIDTIHCIKKVEVTQSIVKK